MRKREKKNIFNIKNSLFFFFRRRHHHHHRCLIAYWLVNYDHFFLFFFISILLLQIFFYFRLSSPNINKFRYQPFLNQIWRQLTENPSICGTYFAEFDEICSAEAEQKSSIAKIIQTYITTNEREREREKKIMKNIKIWWNINSDAIYERENIANLHV